MPARNPMSVRIEQYNHMLVVTTSIESFPFLRFAYEKYGAVFLHHEEIRFKRDVPVGTRVVIVYKPGLPERESERLRRVFEVARVLTVFMERSDDIDHFLAVRLKGVDHGEIGASEDNSGEIRHMKFVLANIPDGVDFNTRQAVSNMRARAKDEGIKHLTKQKLHLMVCQILEQRFRDPKYARFRMNNSRPLHSYQERKKVISILRAEAENQQVAPAP